MIFLTEHHTMKTFWVSGGIAPRILDHGTRWRWVASFTPLPIYPRESTPRTHWIGVWVGSRALGSGVRRKIPSPYRDSNPHHPSCRHGRVCSTRGKGQICVQNFVRKPEVETTLDA